MVEEYEAYIDELTGLVSRKGLFSVYSSFVNSDTVSVLFIDIDNFKTVNDVYGHHEGDRVLSKVGEIIREVCVDALRVRLSGDELVIILNGKKTKQELSSVFDSISSKIIQNKKDLIGFSVISVSAGIVLNANSKDSMESIIDRADTALYSAKNLGKSCCVFYDELEDRIRRDKEIEELSAHVIEKNQIVLKYQPILYLQSSKILCIDVYAMWYTDDGKLIEAKEYRPVFEKKGFLKRFDIYVFELLCKEISEFKKKMISIPVFNVILSRLSLLSSDYIDEIREIMKKYGIEHRDIDISIEENVFGVRGVERIIDALNRLHKEGFNIAVTRFGLDFSSMKYLKGLPISCLRLDSEFIKDNCKDSIGKRIIKAIVMLGKDRKLTVIGYGVDDVQKVKLLESCGCDAISREYDSNQFDKKGIIQYLNSNYVVKEEVRTFRFLDDLNSEDGNIIGTLVGNEESIEITSGISNNWGAIRFNGGPKKTNIIEYPPELFSSNSYTITMWVNADERQLLTSIIYMRYMGGFASVMPYRDPVVCTFRIHEDDNVSVWNDTICRAVDTNTWNHIAVSFDSYSETMRYYINGRLAETYVGAPTLLSCREVILGGDPYQETFKGRISGLIVYDSSKTKEEIATLYESFKLEDGFCGAVEEFWMENK